MRGVVDKLHGAIIVRAVLICISCILIPYFTYKFYTLRLHFIIKGRYPIITVIISNSMLLVCISYLILSFLQYIGYASHEDYAQSDKFWFNITICIGKAHSFGFCSLILYRTWLVHLKWNKSNKNMKKFENKNTIKKNNDSVTIDMHAIGNKFKNRVINFKNILFILNIGGCVYWLMSCHFRGQKLFDQFGQILYYNVILCASIIVLRTWKTKEALSCIRECYMVVFITLTILSSFGIIRSMEWRFFLSTVLALFGSYTLLCLPLIMIYNIEKSIKPDNIFNHDTKNASENICESMSKYATLKEYLNTSHDNFNKFKHYLVDCMAVESLLFYSDVIIFGQILLQLLSKHYPNKYNNNSFNPIYKSVSFNYLENIFKRYKNMINIDVINDDTISTIQYIGNVLKINYIDEFSDNQINISHKCHLKLLQFYDEMSNIPINTDNYSIIIIQYLIAFESALQEQLRLMSSVYNFNFKNK